MSNAGSVDARTMGDAISRRSYTDSPSTMNNHHVVHLITGHIVNLTAYLTMHLAHATSFFSMFRTSQTID